jgi:[ribosomal protein S18]-alanine N-acetyltransferase
MEQACYSDPWPVNAFESLPGNKRVFFAVVDAGGGRIAGYVVAWYVMDEGELANLAVAPAHRGRGIGKLLLDAAIEDARSRHISELYLEVRESNANARRLYESREFVEVTRRKGYYRSPVEDALILRRTLSP